MLPQEITNCLAHKPAIHVFDVRVSDLLLDGDNLIEITRRGQPYVGYWSMDEIRAGRHVPVGESRLYVSQYHVGADVPEDIRNILQGRES